MRFPYLRKLNYGGRLTLIVSIHQPQFLPWLGYFDKIDRSDIFVILDNCQYKKQEYQNRNRIKTSNGPTWLTVPVLIKGNSEKNINEIMIDNSSNWRKRHLNLIAANYRKSPFFDHYYPSFESFYMSKQWEFLSDINIGMLYLLMKMLGMNTETKMAMDMEIDGTKTIRNVNICKALGADTYLSGAGAHDYLEEEEFVISGIKLEFQDFKHPVYNQQHGVFAPYMCAADLIFNEGGKSLEIIRQERAAK